MPTVTLQPDDNAATITRSTDGTSTNDAAGLFPAIPGVGVTITITGTTSASWSATTGSAAVGAYIKYTTDGAVWNSVGGFTTAGLAPPSSSGSVPSTAIATDVGDISDLSLISVRCEASLTLTGDGAGTATATITDWEISYVPKLGIIIGE